jgi:Gpi18-like mannosyltransferase
MDQPQERESGRPSPSRLWQRLDPAFRWALVVFVVTRLLVSTAAVVAVSVAPVQVPDFADRVHETVRQAYPHGSPFLDAILGVWFRWDTGWFNKVAIYGYDASDGSTTVSPLYPLLIRWLGALLGGEYLLASLLVSNLAIFAGLVLLYKLVRLDYPGTVARWTLAVQVALPASFFLFAGYSEPLFLCFAILSVYAARRSMWICSAAAALLAAASRMQGWMLALPLAYEAIRQARERGCFDRRSIVAMAAAPAALLAYNAYLALAGLPGMAETYQLDWAVTYAPPWVAAANAIESLLSGTATMQDAVNMGALALSLALIVISLRRLRPTYWLYSCALQVIFLMGHLEGEQLHSMMRYTLVLFPNAIALALAVIGRRWVKALAVAVLGCVFVPLQLVLVGLFVRWVWIA